MVFPRQLPSAVRKRHTTSLKRSLANSCPTWKVRAELGILSRVHTTGSKLWHVAVGERIGHSHRPLGMGVSGAERQRTQVTGHETSPSRKTEGGLWHRRTQSTCAPRAFPTGHHARIRSCSVVSRSRLRQDKTKLMWPVCARCRRAQNSLPPPPHPSALEWQ